MRIEIARKITFMAVVAGLSLLLAGMLLGQETTASSKSSQNSAVSAMSDTQFAKEAAAGGMAEVELGQLAQQKGSSETVKNFGKKMVEDHSHANEKLTSIASEQKIGLAAGLSRQDQATYDHLSSLSGEAFDKAYARDMVSDHVKDVAAFKKEAATGKNDAIRKFAMQTLPTLETHLKMAREMSRTVGASTASPRTSSPK
jgi:putative membrane protein